MLKTSARRSRCRSRDNKRRTFGKICKRQTLASDRLSYRNKHRFTVKNSPTTQSRNAPAYPQAGEPDS